MADRFIRRRQDIWNSGLLDGRILISVFRKMIIILSFVSIAYISLMICPLGLFIIESNNERMGNEMENAVTKREKISYGLYFMGQNVFYGLIGYMTTYFTDIGITAALVAIVALITKVWDAINDQS